MKKYKNSIIKLIIFKASMHPYNSDQKLHFRKKFPVTRMNCMYSINHNIFLKTYTREAQALRCFHFFLLSLSISNKAGYTVKTKV